MYRPFGRCPAVLFYTLTVALGLLAPSISKASPVALQNATATFSEAPCCTFSFNVGTAIDGNLSGNGWAIDPSEGVNQIAVFQSVADVGYAGGTILTFSLYQLFPDHNLGHFDLAVTTDDRSTFADGLATGGNVTANWVILNPLSALSSNGTTLTTLGDESILASGLNPFSDVYTVTAMTTLTNITGFRLEALTDPSLPHNGPGRQGTNGNFVLTEFQVDAVPANLTPAPEPATLALLGLGLAGLGFSRRRRSVQA